MLLTRRHTRLLRTCLLLALLLLPCFLSGPAAAEPGATAAAQKKKAGRQAAARTPASKPRVATQRGELKAIQGRLKTLNENVVKTEQTRTQARDQLKETELAISHTNRGLRELTEQRSAAEAELDDLLGQANRLENQIVTQQKQLGRLLYQQYTNGDIDALRLLLSGDNANQAAQDLRYMTMLSRAKADLLDQLRTTLNEKQRLGNATRTRREALTDIERQQQQQRATLLTQQQQRQTVLSSIAVQLKAQQREISTLKRDERRLTEVIEKLVRNAVEQARKRAAQKRAESKKTQVTKNHKEKAVPTTSGKTSTPPALARNDKEPEALAAYAGNFSALKGRLRLPVRGELVNRFGQARADSGATWKGLFIRAAEGSEVKAPAPGRVVFADWLRGFGNLLIIDHGDAWLSVYGNNQSLFRHVGDEVKTGDAIAAVGDSGGNQESGLYFELRQRGQAIDPLKWVNLR